MAKGKKKKVDFMPVITSVLGMTAGAAVGKLAGGIIEKQLGAMGADLAKMGGGIVLAAITPNEIAKAVGSGIAVQGAYGLIAQNVPQLAGITPSVGMVHGVGAYVEEPSYLGQFEQQDDNIPVVSGQGFEQQDDNIPVISGMYDSDAFDNDEYNS